jgi:hypothetical protein
MRVFCWVLRDILNSLSLLRAPGTCCGAVNDLMLLGKRDWDGFAYFLLMGDIIAFIIREMGHRLLNCITSGTFAPKKT